MQYVLDPRRKNNQYGGNVLDTLVEKLDGEAGSDVAVILAGYKEEMFELMDNNPGLRRRFNMDDFPFHFEDMSDHELKNVLLSKARDEGLAFEDVEMIDDIIAKCIAPRRRMSGFGNAATVVSTLNKAKALKATRLANAQDDFDKAKKQCTLPPPIPDPNMLTREDFIPDKGDAGQVGRDAFADLCNIEHITKHLDDLESLILQAKEDGREPADILLDAHMVFVGPPGTGKTTVAKRFGHLFKDLDILPSETVTTVTGTSLMGQYVGETKEKVLKYMNQAKGGILFIDEAYGLSGGDGRNGSYGKEAIDTLVGSMTSESFKGNLLVIMAGYEDKMDSLFANANPGFQSRFNKRRIVFEPWTAQQACDALASEIARNGGSITSAAKQKVEKYCRELEKLPSWGSARDVYEAFYESLYTQRANRRRASKLSNSEPYQVDDVEAALQPILQSRKNLKASGRTQSKHASNAVHRAHAPSDAQGTGSSGTDAAYDVAYQPKAKHKLNQKVKTRRIDGNEDEKDGFSDIDILGALERACHELGYDEEIIAQILGGGKTYPRELVEKIAIICGLDDTSRLPTLIDEQKGSFLIRIKQLIESRKKEKSAEEERCQEVLQQMGQCPLGFDWLKEDGGWRCAGGTHFVSDNDIAQACS